MRSMTDEGYGVSHPPAPLAATLQDFLRNTPHPTFADAKATFSRRGRRTGPATPHFFAFTGSFTLGIVANSTLKSSPFTRSTLRM
jgi:hypothetical protein